MRTKESIQKVTHKTDTTHNLNHIIKNVHRKNANKRKEESTTAEANATDRVVYSSKLLANKTRYKVAKFAKNRQKNKEIKTSVINRESNSRTNALLNESQSLTENTIFTKQRQNVIKNARNSAISKTKQATDNINKSINVGTDLVSKTLTKAENLFSSAFQFIKSTSFSVSNLTLYGCIGLMIIIVIMFGSVFSNDNTVSDEPNFNNLRAYVFENPYAWNNLYGQCTWFAWGRFYELYEYSPGFTGDGWNCADQLVTAHSDEWEISDTPTDKCVFSGIGKNHVGIVLYVNGDILTVQEANLDGITNNFATAQKDWATRQYTVEELSAKYEGVKFAVPITEKEEPKENDKEMEETP